MNLAKRIHFKIGSHIWFDIHLNADGEINALEEHDMRAGGHISLPQGLTWEEYFMKCVKSRCPDWVEVHNKAQRIIDKIQKEKQIETEENS